jgi:hypothetical protein
MAEIRVEHRKEMSSWVWVAAIIGVVAIIALVFGLRHRHEQGSGLYTAKAVRMAALLPAPADRTAGRGAVPWQ